MPFVLSFAALAKAGDFVPAHEALNAGCWHVQQLAQKRGVNRKAFFVSFELHQRILPKTEHNGGDESEYCAEKSFR